jgi:hypothetical protein
MAVSTRRVGKPAGRPIRAAVIGSSDDNTIEKRERFFVVCRSLSYRDKLDLSNGLGVTFRTIENWYYGWNMPDEKTRDDVIQWYENGKPFKMILQCESVNILY